MCNMLVIIANIWLTPTKNTRQNFALVSRAMQIDLCDSRRQPQKLMGTSCMCIQRSRAGLASAGVVICSGRFQNKFMIGQWLSHQALRGGFGLSDTLIRHVAAMDVVALPRSEKIVGNLKVHEMSA